MADFFRRDSKPWPYVTILIGIWCVLVFIGVNLQSKNVAAVHRWGLLTDFDVFRGQYWGLISTSFVHVEVLHIAFNLYWLWLLGAAFERNLGSHWMAVFVIVTSIVSSGFELLSGDLGIGLSGVGYALLGFCWMTRSLYPDFYLVANDRIVRAFVIWFFLCIFLTYAHLMQIANFAHLGGLLAGVVAGMFLTRPKLRVPLSLAGVGLVALAILPLFYNPLSGPWNVLKGDEAAKAGNDATAINYYKSSFKGDVNPKYVWQQLARVYERQGDTAHYEEAIGHLGGSPSSDQ